MKFLNFIKSIFNDVNENYLLKKSFQLNSIVNDLIDDYPLSLLKIKWLNSNNGLVYNKVFLGNTLTPFQVSKEPLVEFNYIKLKIDIF